MNSPRRSRRLAGLPPVSVDEESKYEYVSQELHEKNGLFYTDNTPVDFVWIFVVIVLFILPLYIFLANS